MPNSQNQHRSQTKRRIIFYDGNCAICRIGKNLAQNFVSSHSWAVARIQDVTDPDRLLGCTAGQAMDSMHVFDDGQHFHAYHAVVHILCQGRQKSLLYRLLLNRYCKRLGDRLYSWVARSRPCADGGCALR